MVRLCEVLFLSQTEVFKWFKDKYAKGDTSFFMVSEVIKDFSNHPEGVRRCITRLYAYGYLDIKLIIGRPASYRIKRGCVKNGRF